MKYSYSWLKEISKTNKTPEQVADALMMHSFEVESVEKIGSGLKNVVVGKILEINKHPNADRLQLVKLTTDNKQLTTINVVCGANNIKVGDKVPVALVGAKLSNGMEIKEVEIRGVKSFGMLCAEDELGLGKDHSGILILDKTTKIGLPLSKALEAGDYSLEIKVLPDRAHDALSHVGMGREICALENKKLNFKTKKLSSKKTNKVKVEIKDAKRCRRYMAAVMDNVVIQKSHQWIRNSIISCGLKPINNIVDATNYVMLEIGQPLHAFDYDKIRDKEQINSELARITIRTAKKGEKIQLLDETWVNLNEEDLLITDPEKPLAIAGVMGGKFSGINSGTKKIILESASFDQVSIRKTRIMHKLKTDASDRYEKGLDPNMTEVALSRLIEIIESYGGKLEGVTDIYPSKIKPWKIKLDFNYINKLLGEKIPENVVVKILNNLEIQAKKAGKILVAAIPTFRVDLKTQEDLIEEVGRIYGYEKIKPKALISEVQPAKINEQRQFEKAVKSILVGAGFSETYNYSFYSAKDAEMAELSEIKHLELENPMNPNQALMRTSLLPGILKNIRENLKHFKELAIFEIGRVYFPNNNILPEEKNMLMGAIVANETKKGNNFYEAKGYADLLLQKLGINGYYFDEFKNLEEERSKFWHKTRCAEIEIGENKEKIGYVGEINPAIISKFNIDKKTAIFEINLENLQKISEGEREFKPLRKFPISTRDISIIIDSHIKVDEILQIIQEGGGDLVLDVDLFDIYDSEEGKTSFAFHIIFGNDSRTLKNEEVDQLMEKITGNLEKELKVKVRK